ncbi:hypothetical protein BPIT_00150 [Candidatus Brocadia pituitae]|nr:hypothetical protein BPIT_00150 [Candidatus Brocadia pituitae]
MSGIENLEKIRDKIYEEKCWYQQPDKDKNKGGVRAKESILHIKGKEDKADDRQGNKDDNYYAKKEGVIGK